MVDLQPEEKQTEKNKQKRTNFTTERVATRRKVRTGTINVNKEVVVGAINGGMTQAQIQELFSTVGLNCINM